MQGVTDSLESYCNSRVLSPGQFWARCQPGMTHTSLVAVAVTFHTSMSWFAVSVRALVFEDKGVQALISEPQLLWGRNNPLWAEVSGVQVQVFVLVKLFPC